MRGSFVWFLCCFAAFIFSFFPRGISKCKPQFLIKLNNILNLSLTQFWLLVHFRYLSSGFSDLQFSDYNENCSFPGIFSGVFFTTSHKCIYRTLVWIPALLAEMDHNLIFPVCFLVWLQEFSCCCSGEAVMTKFLFQSRLLFLNMHMLGFCNFFLFIASIIKEGNPTKKRK